MRPYQGLYRYDIDIQRSIIIIMGIIRVYETLSGFIGAILGFMRPCQGVYRCDIDISRSSPALQV